MKVLKNQGMPSSLRGSRYADALENLAPQDCLLCDETEVGGLRSASYKYGYKIASRWLDNHQAYGVWVLSKPKSAAIRRKAA